MCFTQRKAKAVTASIPVILNLACCLSVYYCFYRGYLTSIIQKSVVEWVLVVLLHLFLLLTGASFAQCIVTDPGFLQTDSGTDYLTSTKVTFCSLCKVHRPVLTHHCRICNRCVLRYDHHCPWIANCIGLFNHRFYMQYLVYFSLSLLMIGGLSFSESQDFHTPLVLISGVAGLGGGMGLAGFALSQFLRSTFDSKRRTTNSPFDNLRRICGGDIRLWVFPCPMSSHCDWTPLLP